MLGVLAILFQGLVLAVHQPAQAAALSPFDDPAAWCHGPATPADQSAPKSSQHGALVCPICQTLHVAATGLVPVSVALVLPVLPAVSFERAAATASSKPFGHLAANPRAPPAIL